MSTLSDEAENPKKPAKTEVFIEELERYLSFLDDPESEIYCYSLMDPESKEVLLGRGTCFGTASEILELFPRIQLPFTAHVTLNSVRVGAQAKRRTQDIERARVLCVDIDHPIAPAEARKVVDDLGAHMVVETSPGKYHFYWRLGRGAVSLQTWSGLQLALAQKLGGDLSLRALTHTVRMPGVERICKDGKRFCPRIVYMSAHADDRHFSGSLSSIEAIDEKFPLWRSWLAEAEATLKLERDARRRIAKKYLNGEREGLAKGVDALGGRNSALYGTLRRILIKDGLGVGGIEERALEAARALNGDLAKTHPSGGLSVDEMTKTALSAARGAAETLERIREREERMFPDLDDNLDNLDGDLDGKVKLDKEIIYTNGHAPSALYDFDTPDLKQRYSERALAARVVQRFYKSLVRVEGRVFAFSSLTRAWVPQGGDKAAVEIGHFVKECLDDMTTEEGFIARFGHTKSGELDPDKLATWLDRFNSFKMIEGATRGVLNSSGVRVASMDIFDSKLDSVLCANGVVDLLTGELTEPKAEDYFFQSTDVWYERGAKCPQWETFIREVFQKDPDVERKVSFVQEIFGYSLSGHISEKKVFCHYGDGGNGKSKVLEALLAISGGNGVVLVCDDFVTGKNRFSRDPERLGAKLERHRMALVPDLQVEGPWNEAALKDVTEPKLRARAEYEKSRTITNRCKIHIAANILPSADNETEALSRRLCILPYRMRFKDSGGTDERISRMIREEAPGIFNWALEGYRRFRERGGLPVFEEQEQALAEYKSANFGIERALTELYEPSNSEGEVLFANDILEEVKEYLRLNGERNVEPSPKKLSNGIARAFGVKPIKACPSKSRNKLSAYTLRRKGEPMVSESVAISMF